VSVAYCCSDGVVGRMWTQIYSLCPLHTVRFCFVVTDFIFNTMCVAYSGSWPRASVASYVDTVFILDSLCPLHTGCLAWVVDTDFIIYNLCVLHIAVRVVLCPWHRMWTQSLFFIVCVRCILLFWLRCVLYVDTD